MDARLTIALDAMGGDKAPQMVIDGADIARIRYPSVSFLLFGDEQRLAPLLDAKPRLKAACTVVHAEEVVTGDAKPSVALRTGRRSSMRLAIEAVREGQAAGVVSAGNTGALMAMSVVVLRTLAGISRPAIASFFPTRRGETVMLDLGANIECDVDNLVQFAVMGEVFARTVLGLQQPTIGLLNVGAEELKGHEELRLAAARLRASSLPIQFHGFVEGDDIGAGTVDVVVTDGFTGNIALKTAEGTAKLYAEFLRGAFRASWLAQLGYLLARRGLNKVRKRTDPRRYNGAMFLGVNGIVVKSHGGTDGFGFANAVGVAVDMAANRINDKIRDELAGLGATPANSQAATG
ncbi:MAG: phosphate acyltransferase PlsX [Proteobacteria bacterium]|nr:phosphate acyltransferase PlsX [Pseudomonadota bacterium]